MNYKLNWFKQIKIAQAVGNIQSNLKDLDHIINNEIYIDLNKVKIEPNNKKYFTDYNLQKAFILCQNAIMKVVDNLKKNNLPSAKQMFESAKKALDYICTAKVELCSNSASMQKVQENFQNVRILLNDILG